MYNDTKYNLEKKDLDMVVRARRIKRIVAFDPFGLSVADFGVLGEHALDRVGQERSLVLDPP